MRTGVACGELLAASLPQSPLAARARVDPAQGSATGTRASRWCATTGSDAKMMTAPVAVSSDETAKPVAAGWLPRLRGWMVVLPLVGLCAGLWAQAFGRSD